MTGPARPSSEAVAIPLVEVVVTDALTAAAVARLRALLADALELAPAHLVVDLAGCPAADAVAVDVLLTAHRHAFQVGCRLTLRAPSERVRRLLALSRLDHVFDIDGEER